MDRAWEETRVSLPEYNHHGDIINAYWGRLTEERPEFQFYLLGDEDEILARGHSLPLRWDGNVCDLPAGIDGATARGFDEDAANLLCAMLIAIPPDLQGRGFSSLALQEIGNSRAVMGSHP